MIRDAGAGFRTERILTAQLALRGSRYREAAQRIAFARSLEQRLTNIPGAESVALADHLPLLGGRMARLETGLSGAGSMEVQLRAVGPAFLQAMGTTLLAGRDILPGDAENAEPVAVVTEAAAKKIWPESAGDGLGRMVRINGGDWRRVVGISADVKQVLVRPAWPEIMIPLAQEAPAQLALALRAKGDPSSLTNGLRGAVAALDPSLPVGSVMTMDEIIRGYFPRVMLVGIALFSLAATALAATGLYGVIAFLTAQRTREIGIRMALGADRRQVIRLVVSQSLRFGLWGVGAGLLLALAVGKALASFLYGVGAADAVVFSGVSLFLFAVAALAGYFPARRAARTDPMVSLREG